MIKKMYRLPEVMDMTGLSRSSIYLRVSTKEFPKPVEIGRRAPAYEMCVQLLSKQPPFARGSGVGCSVLRIMQCNSHLALPALRYARLF